MMRVAVVTPRYGLDLGGGAENQARGFAEEAARLGWTVEVWTTCARDHYTWHNALPAGSSSLNGVTVHRFPITHWNPSLRAEQEQRLQTRQYLSVSQQYQWLSSGPHSAPLYRHIAAQAGHFDAIIMLPYANPLIHYAAQVAPVRTILWPCLHDEPYAYLEPIRLTLESVWGVMFNSPEEATLACRKLGMMPQHHAILGEGVLPLPSPHTTEVGDHLLYVGRLEEGKNLPQLYDFVERYNREGGTLGLTVVGRGPLRPPHHPAFEFLGFVDEQRKVNACAGALALCQPSLNESFSLVIMESWLAGRPVLVHGDCSVTRGHVQRSKGGLFYRTYPEFVEAVEWLREHPELATRMGQNGRAYVQRNYTWTAVAHRFQSLIQTW